MQPAHSPSDRPTPQSSDLSPLEIFPWNTNFETGITAIDEQHRVLVGLLNGLAEQLVDHSENLSFSKVFDELLAYAAFHFDAEEAIWQEHFKDDSWIHWHQKSHSDFLEGVNALIADCTSQAHDVVLEKIIKFLTHWLAFHILESDRCMAKVVLLLPTGISLEKAKELANQEMSGSSRILIDTILTMYDRLANSAVKMTREIYNRKLAEKNLRRSKENAIAASNAKSSLLATISHEMRTPLSAISTMIFMMRKGKVQKSHQEYLSNIELASSHLLCVINNILDLSKMEAGKLELEERPIDIGAILNNVISLISDRAKEKSLEVEIRNKVTCTNLVGDSIRLQQALLNYADNAVKFTPEGRIAFTTEILQEADDSAVLRFEVSDTGIGIPANSIARLFNRFEQAEQSTSREYGGTGLGLEITRRITEQMDGVVGVESTLGNGSTFWFRVKLKKDPELMLRHASLRNDCTEAAVPDESLRGKKVLVVEDDKTCRVALLGLLRSWGLKADAATSGEGAIKMAIRRSYDLIVMDLQMSRMSGIQATEQLRAHDRTQSIPIIALTGHVDTRCQDLCSKAGMDAFLLKPLDPVALGKLLSKLIKARDPD